MATITNNKQKLVAQLFTSLGKRVRPKEGEARPIVEQFIYGICREDSTRDQADEAYRNLTERFYDWNEVRVSSVQELADAMAGLSDAEIRAQRIIDFLQEVFETTFSFDLELLHKKGIKLAAKQLARYQSASDYVIASVVQHSMGGHAIPLDITGMRVLRRLALLDDEAGDMEAVRAGIEHQVPKARGPHFVDLVSYLADEHCHEAEPACPSCPLGRHCPTGQDFTPTPVAVGARQKSR